MDDKGRQTVPLFLNLGLWVYALLKVAMHTRIKVIKRFD
jgi:hypothetical protein